jgi:hypothetical protein
MRNENDYTSKNVAGEARFLESIRLEGEAIKMYRKGKLFFNAEAKKFFREMADFNRWENLKRELDK